MSCAYCGGEHQTPSTDLGRIPCDPSKLLRPLRVRCRLSCGHNAPIVEALDPWGWIGLVRECYRCGTSASVDAVKVLRPQDPRRQKDQGSSPGNRGSSAAIRNAAEANDEQQGLRLNPSNDAR